MFYKTLWTHQLWILAYAGKLGKRTQQIWGWGLRLIKRGRSYCNYRALDLIIEEGSDLATKSPRSQGQKQFFFHRRERTGQEKLGERKLAGSRRIVCGWGQKWRLALNPAHSREGLLRKRKSRLQVRDSGKERRKLIPSLVGRDN